MVASGAEELSSREMCGVVHPKRARKGQRGQQSSDGAEEGQVNRKESEEKDSRRGKGRGLR